MLVGVNGMSLRPGESVDRLVQQHMRRILEEIKTELGSSASVADLLNQGLWKILGEHCFRYDPDSLLIMSWLATRLLPSPVDNCSPSCGAKQCGRPCGVVWGNISTRSFIIKDLPTIMAVEQGRKGVAAVHELRERLKSYAEKKMSQQFADLTDTSGGFDVCTFFRAIAPFSEVLSLPERFAHCLLRAPTPLIGKRFVEVIPDEKSVTTNRRRDGFSFMRETATAGSEPEPFWVRAHDADRDQLLVGARLLMPGGVELAHSDEGTDRESNFYDFYGVWQIREGAGHDAPFCDQDFKAVQGVIIPVGQRHSLYEDNQRIHAAARAAALAARNLSHNLGSHALLDIADDLRRGKLIGANRAEPVIAEEREQLAVCLDYLTTRAQLIADVAGGALHTFYIPLPLSQALENLTDQGLLMNHLCGRLDFELNASLGDAACGVIDWRGGVVGMHAMFAIIENFARNSARHAHRAGENGRVVLEVTASIVNPAEGGDYIQVTLRDKEALKLSVDKLNSVLALMRGFEERERSDGVGADRIGRGGMGVQEMARWAVFLRGDEFYPHASTPNIEFDQVDRQLTASFRLPVSRPLEFVAVGSKPKDRPAGRAGLRVVEAESLHDLVGRTLPGRWLLQVRAEQVLVTPFGKRVARPERFIDATQSPSASAVIQAQAIWLDSLAQYTLGKANSALHLVIIDHDSFVRLSAESTAPEFGAVKLDAGIANIIAWVGDEGFCKNIGNWRSAVSPAYIAVWDRHAVLASEVMCRSSELRSQLIHYECAFRASEYASRWASLTPAPSFQSTLTLGDLAEAALTRILLIDERLGRHHEMDSETRTAATHANVILYDPDDDDADNWPSRVLAIARPGGGTRPPNELPLCRSMPFACATVHASLKSRVPALEAWAQSNDAQSAWREFVETLGKNVPYVSLHSGLGGDSNAEALEASSLPFSCIKHSGFGETACKATLAATLLRGGIAKVRA